MMLSSSQGFSPDHILNKKKKKITVLVVSRKKKGTGAIVVFFLDEEMFSYHLYYIYTICVHHALLDESTGERMNGRTDGRGWTDRLVDRDGWMDGWTEGFNSSSILNILHFHDHTNDHFFDGNARES